MGDPWGIGGFRGGGGKGLEGANHKEIGGKIGKKISTVNGLKSIGNSKKSL